jgi:hypothetical protein
MDGRVWLSVPYAEKDAAKAAGARWDQQSRRWFAVRPGIPALQQWAEIAPVPELLPGEDRSFGSGLFVDLVPSSCWFTNVRSCVDTRDWDRLRTMVYTRAGNRCEACGATRNTQASTYLEAHERWQYDDTNSIQHLRRLVCLCTPCHTATHYGLAGLQGKADEASTHLRTVCGWSNIGAHRHIAQAFDLWKVRSRRLWTLDLSILTSADIRLKTSPAPETRSRTAR